jgi:hypothetical protein
VKVKRIQSKLAPSVSRWAHEALPGDRCTVIARLGFSADPEAVARAVTSAGGDVRQSLRGVLVAEVNQQALETLESMEDVVAVELPSLLYPVSVDTPD